MAEAFFWGAAASSALLLGAVIAYTLAPGRQVIAIVMALGSGLLIGSVAFELIDDALKTRSVFWVAVLVLIGAGVFTLGDWLLTRGGAGDRKDPTGAQAGGSPLVIVLGSVLDGIPESFVLGLTVLQGGVSPSLLVGVALSNLPEGMSSSSGLKAAGWPALRVLLMWGGVVLCRGCRPPRAICCSIRQSGARGRSRKPSPPAPSGDAGRHIAPRGVRRRRRPHRSAGRRRLRDLSCTVGRLTRQRLW